MDKLVPSGRQRTVYSNYSTFWEVLYVVNVIVHHNDVLMGAIASQITSLTIVFSVIYLDTDQRKHQSSASLAFVWGIHRGRPVTRKMFPFDDVITTLMLQERNQRNNVIELINFSHFLLVALLCENICMQAYKIHQRLIHSHIIFFLWIMLLKRFCQFLCSLRLSTVPNNMLNKTTHCRHDDVERSTHIRITMWPWKIMFHERLLQRSLGNT